MLRFGERQIWFQGLCGAKGCDILLNATAITTAVEMIRSSAARNTLGLRSVEIFTSENHGFIMILLFCA
jgi:hypothetical protein